MTRKQGLYLVVVAIAIAWPGPAQSSRSAPSKPGAVPRASTATTSAAWSPGPPGPRPASG
jgi:hypothetical protein